MKTLIAIIVFVLTGAVGAYAQNVDREVFPEQVSIEHNQAVKSFSRDFVITLPIFTPEIRDLPDVDRQTAMITQTGADNTVTLEQTGALNFANIATIGNNNTVDWSQIGMRNWVKVELIGDDNTIDGDQFGRGNQLNLNYTGDGLNQSFLQVGNSHYLEFNGVGIPMSVTQRGNGAAIIIENR